MKTSHLIAIISTTVGAALTVATITVGLFVVLNGAIGEVRADIREIRTDIAGLHKDLTSLTSRVAHIEGQLLHLALPTRTADATAVGETEPSPAK